MNSSASGASDCHNYSITCAGAVTTNVCDSLQVCVTLWVTVEAWREVSTKRQVLKMMDLIYYFRTSATFGNVLITRATEVLRKPVRLLQYGKEPMKISRLPPVLASLNSFDNSHNKFGEEGKLEMALQYTLGNMEFL